MTIDATLDPAKLELSMDDGLRPGNITVNGIRTSVRLEPMIWEALREIAQRERMSVHALCTTINRRRRDASLTSAIRVFVIMYFRNQCGGLVNAGDSAASVGQLRRRFG